MTVTATVVVILVGIRALLPWFVEHYINSHLREIGVYRGHVADVDLSLIRGAYVLHDLRITKPEANVEQPFLALAEMDISVEWSALLSGELVGEIQMQNPIVNMVQGETDKGTQIGTGVNWPDQVRKLFPFRFNRVEATNGKLTFRAPGIETEESLTLVDVRFLATNLTNVRELEKPAFADFEFRADFNGTPLALDGHLDPNAEQPTFDVNVSLEGADLVDVNPWLRKFLNVDAEKGVFSMYAELAAADGRFEGYIKPLLEDVEILRLDEPASGPLQKLWEGLVGIVAAILTNREEDQVATRIPFSGELDNPDAGILSAAVNLVRNAFVAAFTHSIERSVSIKDVESDDKE